MIVVGWNNGSPNNKTGAGYGIRLVREARDKLFQKAWTSVAIKLDGGDLVNVRLSNSFWKACIELRSVKIGKWMLNHKLAPWPEGNPPHLIFELVENRKFKLSRL